MNPFESPNESSALKIKGAQTSLLAAKHWRYCLQLVKICSTKIDNFKYGYFWTNLEFVTHCAWLVQARCTHFHADILKKPWRKSHREKARVQNMYETGCLKSIHCAQILFDVSLFVPYALTFWRFYDKFTLSLPKKEIEELSVVHGNKYELISTHCVSPLKKYVFLPLKSS